jgi:hypothetical protein
MPVKSQRKTRWWLVLLLLFGGVFVLAGLVIGGAAWWLRENRERLVEQGKEATAEGRTYAATHDQDGCVDEGLRQLKARSGFLGEAEAKIFLKSCLAHASKSPRFCSGVPRHGAVLDEALWLTGECERRHRPEQSCTRVLQAIPEVCTNPSFD